MSHKNKYNIDSFELIILDFDGVLTDNHVYLSENGIESVKCSRADGLGFDALRRINKKCIILSTENNKVVTRRAEKIGVEAFQGVKSKTDFIESYTQDMGIKSENIIFVGNDLNDFHAMSICGLAICPSDAHEKIKAISDIVLSKAGGEGIIREILEDFFDLNIIKLTS